MSRDGKITEFVLLLIGGGGYLFYNGLRKMKIKRRIMDTPRSKISSAALGHNIEVHGKIFCEKKNLISSPLSLQQCACYVWELQKLIGSGKDRYWETQSTLFSRPFLYLIDESQELAAIDLSSVEFNEEKWDFTKDFNETGDTLPTAVRTILETHQMMKFSSDSSSRYRLNERYFFPDEDLYVLGTAILTPAIEKPLNPEESSRFGAHKPDIDIQAKALFDEESKDCYVISNYDKNRNLVLDQYEQEQLMKDIQSRLQSEHAKDNASEYLKRSKFLFTMAINEEVALKIKKVFISKHSEEELVKNLTTWIKIGLIGGPILITIGIWIVMDQLNY